MSQTLQYCQRSYFENTLIVRKAAECNLWELLIIVNLFRALKQQHVGLNGKRQHEGEITAIKLALKTVCLSLERLIFRVILISLMKLSTTPAPINSRRVSARRNELIARRKAGKAFIHCRGQILGSTAFLSQVFHLLCAW